MATETRIAPIVQLSVREQLEHLAGETAIFVSMPFVRGITPKVLLERGEKELSLTEDGVPRYSGIFRPEEIGLPIFDHGLLYGDGVFEGLLVTGKRIFQWREHLQRLYSSAARLGISIPYDPLSLTRNILNTVRNTIGEGKAATYLRLVVTRGIGDLGIQPAKCLSSSVCCIASRLQLYPHSVYDRGINLALCRSTRRSGADTLAPQIKSSNYLNNILAWIETSAQGCQEALMLTQNGYVSEATTDNLFVITKQPGWEEDPSKVIVSTPEATYCLPGITRSLVLEYARSLGFHTDECGTILPSDLLGPNKEVFLTGTAAGLIAVATLDSQVIGDGKPGLLTHKLCALLSDDLDRLEMGLSAYASPEEASDYLKACDYPKSAPVKIGSDFVQRMFNSIDACDWDSLDKFFATNMTYERPGYAPLVGYERMLEFYKEERVIAAGRHCLDAVVVGNNSAACWGKFVGQHKNGSAIDERFADTYKFENGKIKKRISYFFRPAI